MIRRWATAVLAAALLLTGCSARTDPVQPTAGTPFDYQLGGDYPLPDGVEMVVRQWSGGEPASGAYSVCYVNAFQTEAEPGSPDGIDNWPEGVVWDEAEDPEWPGEHPIDIGSTRNRRLAVQFVQARFQECATRGFDAIELDNLDTYLRYDDAPFDRDDTIAYATMLVEEARQLGLAVAQKNTVELLDVARGEIGFGFALTEECGSYDECDAYVEEYDGAVFDVEYTEEGFAAACAAIGDVASVIRRDLDLTPPDSPDYVFERC